MARRAIDVYCCKDADGMDSFYLEGGGARVGRRGEVDKGGEGGTAVNDYCCKMTVCWTEKIP